ncbi:glycoside hydrolase family 3 protein [Orbus sturtevantii]|uniref:glycoside hydrolase family 3 protein n=1 Tax=Orbus sturtevantii TaxID=3074109 RepID=UPI00370D921B
MKKLLLLLIALSGTSLGAVVSNDALKQYWQSPETSAKQIVNEMSFEEKIGQMLMFDFRKWGLDEQQNKKAVTEPTSDISNIVKQYHLGSVILFRENLINIEQMAKLIDSLQQARSNLPLFISTDQEGGYVTRLQQGTEMPGNMALGATRSPTLASISGMVHGYELSNLGFNFNFGPVVDINNNQNNPVIGVRSYSDNPLLVTDLARSYIDGIHQYGIMTSLKHFPGHGNVATDTHFALPTINIDEQTWRNFELSPFVALMDDSDAIMTAHVVVPALDSNMLTTKDNTQMGTPATLSRKILTDILRKELSYSGLIITDAMDMGAIASNFDKNWSIKQAIMAGNDIVLMPLAVENQDDVQKIESLYQYLKQEAIKDPLLMQQIDESATRIVKTKLAKKLAVNEINIPLANDVVASPLNKDIENKVAEASITLIKNNALLPYKLQPENKIVIFSDELPRNELIAKHLKALSDTFAVNIDITDYVVKMMANDSDKDTLTKQIAGQDLVLLTTYNLTNNPYNAQAIIDVAKAQNVPVVVISSRNPYDIAYLDNVDANIAIYGITGFDVTNNVRNSLETNIRSGIRTLFESSGKILNYPHGKLPVDIKSADLEQVIYPYGHGLSY